MQEADDYDDSEWLCLNCIGDQILKDQLTGSLQAKPCSFCGSNNCDVISLAALAEQIDGPLRDAYRLGEEQAALSVESDRVYYDRRGASLVELLVEELEIDDGPAEALSDLLCDNDPADIRHGGEAFFSAEESYERSFADPSPFYDKWQGFEQRLTHQRRFFDDQAGNHLAQFFGGSHDGASVPLATLTTGRDDSFDTVFRARLATTTEDARLWLAAPEKHLASPPPPMCRAGRMNSAGIPVFYAALAEKTAIAEIRPPVGSLAVVGAFSLARPLRLLDLTKLGQSYLGSVFAPDYVSRASLASFLSGFHRKVARPVLPGEEALGYLATQAVSEYILEVLGYDGILFASTQSGALTRGIFDDLDSDLSQPNVDLELCNVVLSSRLEEGAAPVIRYIEDSVRAVRITAAEVEYEEEYRLQLSDVEVESPFDP